MVDSSVMFKAGGCCCCAFTIFLIVALSTSFSRVEQTEWCLKYNWWSESISDHAITEPGVQFVGMGNHLVRYPNTNRYVYFREHAANMERKEGDIYKAPVTVRTLDGLTINVELEFVYRLQRNNLPSLYNLVGESGHNPMLALLAAGVINVWSSIFTAQEFYTNRTLVANKFENELRAALNSTLFVDVQSVQLQPAHFPAEYSAVITETQEMRQDIEVSYQERKRKIIKKQSQLLNSTELAKQQAINAEGDAKNTLVQNEAAVAQFLNRQEKAAKGYKHAFELMITQLSPAEAVSTFMSYLKVQALSVHTGKNTAVKLTPAY